MKTRAVAKLLSQRGEMDCSRKLVNSPFFVTYKSPSLSFQVATSFMNSLALAVQPISSSVTRAILKKKQLHPKMLIMQRNLEGPYAMELTLGDLVELEKQLHVTLTHVRDRKIQMMLESVKSLHDQEKMVKEENQLLEKQIVAMKNGKDSDHPMYHPPQQTTLSLLK